MNLLFDDRGAVVSVFGLTRAERTPGEAVPSAFFYPLTQVPEAVLDSVKTGASFPHGLLGIRIRDVTGRSMSGANGTGVEVIGIHRPEGKEADIEVGDVIKQFKASPVTSSEHLRRLTAGTAAGTEVAIVLYRPEVGQIITVVEVLERQPRE